MPKSVNGAKPRGRPVPRAFEFHWGRGEIIEELRSTRTSERSGRAQDKESEDAFEKLRRDGYM